MQIMKRVLALFLLLFILSGCGPTDNISLTYAGKDIECEIAYAWDDMNIRGIFKSRKSEAGRDIEFTFIEPDALCGVRVKRVGTEVSAELDGIEICADEFAPWLGVEALFESEGEIVESSLTELGGERLNKVVLSTEDGNRLEIFLSGDSGYPVMVCGAVNGRPVEGKVLRFTEK